MPEDPLTGYRFVITLDPGDAHLPRPQADQIPRIAAGAFSEVTGLGGELEITSYAEGGVNGYVHQLPVRHSWGRITLRRGVVRDPGLWSWYEAGADPVAGGQAERRDRADDPGRHPGGGLGIPGRPGGEMGWAGAARGTGHGGRGVARDRAPGPDPGAGVRAGRGVSAPC